MNKKIMAVVIVVILIIAAIGVVVATQDSNDKDSNKKTTDIGTAAVFGNVNNDNYLDYDDIETLNEIIKSGYWDEEMYPYADANQDEKVDGDDIQYIQNFLNSKKQQMYYIGSDGGTYYFNYPSTGKAIAASSDYGLMLLQVLGIYDRVTYAAQDRVIDRLDEIRYPGCTSFKTLGNYTSSDYDTFVENFLQSGCQILVGQVTNKVYNMIHDSGKEADLILLSSSAEIQSGGIDVVSCILTAGILLDCGEKARAYADYFEEITNYLDGATNGVPEKDYLLIYNPSNAVTCTIHTSDGKGGWKGDAWNMQYLPLMTDFKWNGTAANGKSNGVEIETVLGMDPEVLVFSIWNKTKDASNPADVQKIVDDMAEYFKESSAYKNGKIYAVEYETYGTYVGVAGLYLLASYIWPDHFDTDKGWELFEYGIKNFTLIDTEKVDITTLGGMIPYHVNTSS